ncbi:MULTISPECIES: precorrin-2 C(20)-methyltransferase [unclassified Roseitalea]|uniref:precorrin-2 C(20)-methyltransferase n=1 Tax=unclassified Roseitalea TaxID=2639107 RepID=UPI00273D3C75|nr:MULTISPECIES: precorrin-2 C(20)-methyltransferase [unclassified Roseitalea]
MSGTLYGIGVGPGAPDLITLRAYRLLTAVPVIAWPAPETGESFARSIVAGCIRADHAEIPIRVPMRPGPAPAGEVYDRVAPQIAAHLDAGRDVAVVCAGDPFFYGSFMYLYERLAGRYRCEIVPGISSVMAGAAALGLPLAGRNDVLTVVPAPLDDAAIAAQIEAADAAVIIKVGRHLPRVRALIDAIGLIDGAWYAERVTLANERVMPLAEAKAEPGPYFSMIYVGRAAAGPAPAVGAGPSR